MTVSIIPANAPVEDLSFNPIFEEQRPFAVAVIDGNRFLVNSFEIDENAHGATNAGHVTLPIAGNPDFTVLLFRDDKQNAPVYIELYGGLPQNLVPEMLDLSQLTKVFTGIVDQYSATLDKDSGAVTFALRSLASVLVDNKITTLAMNMTGPQFLQAVCKQYGLTCDTSNIIGTPITIQEVLGQMNVGGSNFSAAVYGMHIWDLLLKCAEFDDVDVWENARTGVIYYAAPSLIKRNTVYYKIGNNLERATLVHSPQFSKNIRVEVRTYQRKTRVSYSVSVDNDGGGGVNVTTSQRTVTSSPVFGTPNMVTTSIGPNGTTTTTSSSSGGAFSSGFTAPGSESGKERYIIYAKNLSPAAANKLAQAKARQIAMHEYSITLNDAVTAQSIGDLQMTSLIQLSGSQYEMFNDTYWPRKITTSMSVTEGWKRTIEAVNHALPQGAV